MAPPLQNHQSENNVPDAELNPLLNPILAQNMGRWAEVYFTTPPERREQAIVELIRELEGQRPTPEAEHSEQTYAGSEQGTDTSDQGYDAVQAQAPEAPVCASCGEVNPQGQKFCGMCGAPLEEFFNHADEHASAQQAGDWEQFDADSAEAIPESPSDRVIEYAASDEQRAEETSEGTPEFVRPIFSAYAEETTYRAASRREAVDEHSGQELPTLFAQETVPYRYRVYVGVLLAVLIGALGYMGWRAAQAWPNDAHVLPAATTPQAEAPAPSDSTPAKESTPAAQSPRNADSRNAATASEEANRTPAPTSESAKAGAAAPPVGNAGHGLKSAAAAAKTADKESSPVRSASTKEPDEAPSGSAAQNSSVAGNGNEELAVAERFLNGSGGHARDTNEAAKWLWQAVAKQNAPATLLLADLYLHGDGVPKNCDQGRLLLYAAARKGIAAAGERLRNLPAFGCQ